ncbi:Nodule Cysteine-Rich (NCR) secreted peptide [Medicago truncatula]|uniref:Nodule Cysteine-Rich (NCR) secreted peptide n=2 Tax=Medicago truncatula TaxID=3880 RepID=G7ISZ8_MEDTR|nr:Nodule Cysteine-Rich (NCR) secreted peptide [Medicago truncatula]
MSKNILFNCAIILFLSLFLVTYFERFGPCSSDSDCPSFLCDHDGVMKCFSNGCSCVDPSD